jgi:lipopolysaccharide export system protein LptC
MFGRFQYSSVVLFTKVFLPLVALAMMSTLFLFSRNPDPNAALPLVEVDMSQLANEQRISAPRFSTTSLDGRQIMVSAAAVSQSFATPDHITIDTVEADVELRQGDMVRFLANTGQIDVSQHIITLTGAVHLSSQSGLEIASEEIAMDIVNLRLTSNGSLTAMGPGFTIRAGGMVLQSDSQNATIDFTNGVHLLHNPGG